MTDNQLAAILHKRLNSCVSKCDLPNNFSSRLVTSVRRHRISACLRIALICCLPIIAIAITVSLADKPTKTPVAECVLTAPDEHKTDETISGWMLIGFLREYFKTPRNSKRRNEKNDN